MWFSSVLTRWGDGHSQICGACCARRGLVCLASDQRRLQTIGVWSQGSEKRLKEREAAKPSSNRAVVSVLMNKARTDLTVCVSVCARVGRQLSSFLPSLLACGRACVRACAVFDQTYTQSKFFLHHFFTIQTRRYTLPLLMENSMQQVLGASNALAGFPVPFAHVGKPVSNLHIRQLGFFGNHLTLMQRGVRMADVRHKPSSQIRIAFPA